jgi:BRCT domain type II-containing protein
VSLCVAHPHIHHTLTHPHTPALIGAANCLGGLKFVLTGLLDSLEREVATDLIKEYGGQVQASLSKKVTHLLAGIEPGPSKLDKAKELGLKIIGKSLNAFSFI